MTLKRDILFLFHLWNARGGAYSDCVFLRTIAGSHKSKVLDNKSSEFYVSHRTCVKVSHIKQHNYETTQLKTKENREQLCVACVN